MKSRMSHSGIFIAWPLLLLVTFSGSFAFHAQEQDSKKPRFTYGTIISPPASSVVQSTPPEKAAAQFVVKNRSLLSSRYGAVGHLEMNPSTGVLRRLRGIPIAKGLKSTATLKDKESLLRQFVDENPELMGLKSSHLALLSQTEKLGRSYFAYHQKVDGLPVYGAYLKATLDSQGILSVLTSSCWPEVKYSSAIKLSVEETAAFSVKRILNQKDSKKTSRYQLKRSEKVLFPLSTPEGNLFLVSYRQVIHLEDPLGDWVTVVDANSGREYVRYNNYRFASTHGTVQGEILPAYYNDTPQMVPFENESVHILSQTPAYSWDLSSNPGWSMEGLWAFGIPDGAGGDANDNGPVSGHTGSDVLGYNLTGGYVNDITTTQFLTSQAIDCSALSGTCLSFWRWLGIESADYDHACLEVSNNGTEWLTVWKSYETRICHEWEYCVYIISAIADGESSLYIRWGMGPTDGGLTYAGLYLDDICILSGSGTTTASGTGEFNLQVDFSGTPILQSVLKGPYSDVVNEDGPRLQYYRASPSDPAGWNWSIPELTVVQSWNLDINPGWSTTGDWAWGTPLGAGNDPAQGRTGNSVYGYNLSGAYSNDIASKHYLITPPLNCTGYFGTHLRFWRWLGIESNLYDSAFIQVSNDNSTWHTVYQNSSSSFQDTSWIQLTYDISYVADDQSTVFIRWGLGPTDSSVTYSGWNIDDIELLADPIGPDYTIGLYDKDELNVFYHMGVVRKSIKAIDPSFTGVDFQMPGVVRVGTEYANAYFDGVGLNFGEGDGISFRNLALFADVIYHEFTHAVTHRIYPDELLPYSGETGAMDEAWSDYFACTITNDPMIGDGGTVIGRPWLRNMDNNLSSPEDLELEVHKDGRIIGAGLWNLRVLLGKNLADQLIHFSRFSLAGSFLDYYEDLLITDDNDSNLQNGTPHMLEIAKSFGPHGIGGLRIDSVSQEVTTEIFVNGKLDGGETGSLLPHVTSHFVAENVQLAAQSGSPYLSIGDANVAYGSMEYTSTMIKDDDRVGVTISSSCPEDEILPVTFTLTAMGGYSSTEIHRLINAPGQILYDEGKAQGTLGYGGAGGGLAVRFTPPNYPVTLNTLRLMPEGPYTGVDPVPILVKVWDDDGAGGGPGTLLTPLKTVAVPLAGAWYEVPLSFDMVDTVYTWNMESNPGWSMHSGWQRGSPAGLSGDPPSAYSGSYMFGYNLSGPYQNNLMSTRYLTTGAIDCSFLEGTTLQFQRWLGVERTPYDHASVEVSNDGTTWTRIWENGSTSIVDQEWTQQSFDISSTADGKKTVYVRWGMGPTDDSVVFCGWNIDDVAIKSKTGVTNGITINEGDIYVGWLETDTTYYNGVTWKRPDNRGWFFDADQKKWFTLLSAGYPMDLMVRVRYEVPTGVQVWSEY